MTINDLWNLCETQRKRGFGSQPVRIFKRDSGRTGMAWGPYAVGQIFSDPQSGTVTLEATEPCEHCGRP